MQIIPAIDIKDGNVVRLVRGDMSSAKIYSKNPCDVAKEFQDLGASIIHIVDLNGAFIGEPKNFSAIKKIKENTSLKIQLGGGIRSEESIKNYINLGIDKIILGSIALKDSSFVKSMSERYNIIVGVDAKSGYVATDGWDNISSIKAKNFVDKFKDSKVESFICTDINRDGLLDGINMEFIKSIAALGVKVIASGGFKEQSEIVELKKIRNVVGIIVGKAFYEKKVNLKTIFKAIKK